MTSNRCIWHQILMPHLTQSRSLQRQSSQPITWLILTNKTVQENMLYKFYYYY